MDISTIIGLIVAFGSLIFGYILEKGVINSLFLLSPFIIVFGGTMGAVILSYGFHDLGGAVKSLFKTFLNRNLPNPEKLIEKISQMADTCRKDGLLSLQSMLEDADLNNENYLLLKEGIILTLDMKSAEVIVDALESDIQTYALQKQFEIDVFQGAGGFSPTLGIIGTVMGLVQVLSSIADAQQLTAAIATAFIATLYGVVFANLIYIPAANRLRTSLKRQRIFREMMVEGICMVSSGRSSRDVENQLSLYYHAFPGGEKKYKDGVNN